MSKEQTDALVLTERGYVLTGRKHGGKTLGEVTQEDPDYLVFLFQKCPTRMTEEAFYTLADVLRSAGYDLSNLRKRKNSPHTGAVGVDSPAD